MVATLAATVPADESVRVVITADAALALFGPYLPIPPVPGLMITADLHAALSVLETTTIDRLRGDPRRLRRHTTAPTPFPRRTGRSRWRPVLLVVPTIGAADQGRAATLLRHAHRVGVAGVVLGDWPPGRTLAVDAHGVISSDRSSPPPPVRNTMVVLPAAEAFDVLTLLAQPTTAAVGDPADDEPAAPTAFPARDLRDPPPPARSAASRTPTSTDAQPVIDDDRGNEVYQP